MISEEACSSPARVNSISSARLNLASAATRSSCWVSAAATRSGGYRPRSAWASSSARSGPTRSPASRSSNSRPSGDSRASLLAWALTAVPPPGRSFLAPRSQSRRRRALWLGQPSPVASSLAPQFRRHRPRGSNTPEATVVGRPTIEVMSLDFPAFALSPEHDALRESVRALADEKIAPNAAKVDQVCRVPAGSARCAGQGRPARGAYPGRLRRRGRRRDRDRDRDRGGGAGLRVVLADPRGQQAGHGAAAALPASEDVKQRYLPPVARGRGDVLVRAVRARGRLRRGRDEDPGGPRR